MARHTRRDFLALGAAAAATLTAGVAPRAARRAHAQGVKPLRVGVVVPARTGLSTVRTSINDYTGEGARMGAILAEAVIGDLASEAGFRLELLHANSPSPDAAHRAAQRLAETGRLCALVGGIGDGQAEIIAAIAEKARIPFFNVGSSADALRQGACSRYTFHVEASAAMYLDALAAWGAAKGYRRWFVVYENTANGRAAHQRAAKALAKHGAGGTIVGAAAVQHEQPIYYNEVNAIEAAKADVAVLMLDVVDQIAFMAQQENTGLEVAVATFPEAISQTRDYIVSARSLAPVNNPRQRIALWETTLQANGAGAFNERFTRRWSEPADPTAWAAYYTIKMLFEAVKTTGSVEADPIMRHLRTATFDVAKGPGVSFRPWDQQLRQPLYVVDVDQDSEWIRTDVDTWVALAKSSGQFPSASAGGNTAESLDRFGDSATDSACRIAR